MKINKYILSVLAVATGTLFAVSCDDDVNNNTNTQTPGSTDSVIFGEAPSSAALEAIGTPVDIITEDTVRYHVVLPGDGIFTVTIIETATDAILVDVGPDDTFVPGFGTELEVYAEAIGKPLSIIMTHNHFDHYGTMDKFTDVQVYTHEDVAPLLRNNTDFTDRYGVDNATSIIPVSSSLELGGLTFNFDTIQNAETGENGYIYIESLQAVFVADLVYNRAHNYIREYTPLDGTDEIQNWLDGLGLLNEKFGTYAHIFCGHGGTTTDIPEVIRLNEEYLNIARNLINGSRELTNGGTASTSTEVVDELLLLYPLGPPTNYKVSGSGFALPGAFGPDDPGADWFPEVVAE